MDMQQIRQRLRAESRDRDRAPPPPKPWRWGRALALVTGCLFALPLVVVIALYALSAARERNSADDAAPKTGRFVTTTKGRVFVQELGPADGQIVILVHGAAAWSELWRETMTHLAAEKFRVVAIDLPPFGFSDRPTDGDFTRAAQAGRIAALIDALGAGPVLLVGHSFGGGPATETAMRYPEKVRGLVLVAAALGLYHPDGPAQPTPRIVMGILDTPAIRDPLIASVVTNPWLTGTLVGTMVHRKDAVTAARIAVLQRPMTLRNSTADLGRWLRTFMSVDTTAISRDRARFAGVRTPTRLIWGDRDQITPLPEGRDLQALIAGATLSVMTEIGHMPQIEDAAAFGPLLVRELHRLE
jgi:pimeloyl-ACP methyl ester carboxylesterase